MVTEKSAKEQINLIQQLREDLDGKAQTLTDQHLEQFLIANNWHLKETREHLKSALIWRAENKIDLHPVATTTNHLPLLCAVRGFTSVQDGNVEAKPGVSESVLRIVKNLGGIALHKTDNDGCPVYIERLGYHASKNLAKQTTIEEFVNYHIGCKEFVNRVLLDECSHTMSKSIRRETIILDCTGMGWHQLHMPALRYIRVLSELDDKYYPDAYNKLYIINAPSAFVHVWKIVKGWIHPATIAKIQIMGSNYKDTLLQQIPAENLPVFLGGNCTCAHMPGGCVPSHQLKNVPPLEPQPHNERTPQVYNTDIMEIVKKA
ncbi:hypothetical protein DFQ28_010734 [Apophysomyces sp. BC1034]|nr:hypothetical protein DFQ30_010487 [Apophysomyces sp. BC1015]KAG0182717.1 hypothetical protein DFQ29_002637 [Apophysomyces sp. BC1021]KAG0191873.1 hypothetical protein DFQ28_010734 [Apophysomyces sp. BC1034]